MHFADRNSSAQQYVSPASRKANISNLHVGLADFVRERGGAHAFQDAARITYMQVDKDEPLKLQEGWRVANIDALGSGLVIRRCTIKHVRARGIFEKASDGLIEGYMLTNPGEYLRERITLTPSASAITQGGGFPQRLALPPVARMTGKCGKKDGREVY